jgi:poly(3-hydroxybutyrate) depolymerase
MYLQRRPTGVALLALCAFALCLSCEGSTALPTGTGGTSAAGAAGTSGGAGTNGAAGTTASAGSNGAAGTTAAAGTNGAAGTTAAAGTNGAAGTTAAAGTNGAAGTAAAAGRGGTTGAAGTTAAAGRGGTTGAAGTTAAAGRGGTTGAAGTTAAAGRGGTTGAAGRGGTTGTAGTGAAGTSGAAGSGVMPSSGCGKAAGITNGRKTIDVNGEAREYIISIPSNYNMNNPYRLIFGWHPWGGSAVQTQQMGYFGLMTPSNGQAVLVAPEGQNFQDGGLGWGNAGGKDIAFAHAMMDYFGANLCIDQNRIFSTGFSFGAMFSFTLACTANSMQRAIAPMAGNTQTSGGCENSTRSVATMAFIGTNDSLLSGHRSAVQVFRGRNGCATTRTTMTPSWCDGVAAQFQPCTCWQYDNCTTGYPTIECEYLAGHQFAPSSGTTLWNFFSQF